MSKNNPVGNIPIATPMLKKILRDAMHTYYNMTTSEKKALDAEIKSVTETNCDYMVYDMAQMLKHCVSADIDGN